MGENVVFFDELGNFFLVGLDATDKVHAGRSELLHKFFDFRCKLAQQCPADLVLVLIIEQVVDDVDNILDHLILVLLFKTLDLIFDIALTVEDRELRPVNIFEAKMA